MLSKSLVQANCGMCQVLPLPPAFAKRFETILKKFVWTGKLEKLAIDETKNSREEGGMGLVCISSKADALFLRQTCRLLASPDFNSYKHIKYWVGHHLVDELPDMGPGQHADQAPEHFQQLKRLFKEAHALEIIDVEHLSKVPAKQIYEDYTSSFPPPKIESRYADLPWNDIWSRLNHPVLTSPVRDIMFLLIHNCLPTRDRLLRLNMCDNATCPRQDGLENTEHLFTSCTRSQVAWAWMRRKVTSLMPDWVAQFPSDFELLHLVYNAQAEAEILWMISHYCNYVWDLKTRHGKNFTVDVDKLRVHLQELYIQNQASQNALTYIPF